MKTKYLIIFIPFIFLGNSKLKAQEDLKLQLNYDWTRIPASQFDQSTFSLKIQSNVNPLSRNNKTEKPDKSLEKKYHILITKPNVEHLVAMPYARIDSSLRYHLRIKDLESDIEENRNK